MEFIYIKFILNVSTLFEVFSKNDTIIINSHVSHY